MELDKIYNEECLVGMSRLIPDGSIDAVICDLPYGTMKGINEKYDWDETIPTERLFQQYSRVLRYRGVAILFSQEPYTSHLRSYPTSLLDFSYPLIWKKDSSGNSMMAKSAPVSYFEDINVFHKREDSSKQHPLRPYFKQMKEYIGLSGAYMKKYFNSQRMRKLFNKDSREFALCTEESYNLLIEHFHIDRMSGYRTYADLKAVDLAFKEKNKTTFNLQHGKLSMSNILEFRKDLNGFHPTQKPVALIQTLVETYTNPGDVVLDNCMGSGTTAVACHRAGRHFIGFELNKQYFDQACQRIKNEQAQLRLF